MKAISGRQAYGEALVELGRINEKVVVLDADAAQATKSIMFKEKYPERFFDMGIAEQDMMCTAAGLSIAGFIPFVSTFAVFGSGRAFEQIRNSIAYPEINVKIALSHTGITSGGDGATHQSVEDIAIIRAIPNMKVISPADGVELKKAVFESIEISGPVYIRGFRYISPIIYEEDYEFILGKASVLKDGIDVCIVATGIMVYRALKAAENLEKKGVNAAVLNMSSIKPIDDEILLKYAKSTGKIVTVEEHSIIGGLGGAVLESLAEETNVKVKRIGLNDCFGQSGEPDDMLEAYGLTTENIENVTLDFLKR